MPTYPQHLTHEHGLFDGSRVTIRPVRPDDEPLEREFLDGLAAGSRYQRFQKSMYAPSEKLVQFLSRVDYDAHMAFVCTTQSGNREKVIGDARYVIGADGKSCEFGIVIADAWHNSGIAALLMQALMNSARERGVETMEGYVLAGNHPMRRFASMLGFLAQPMSDDPLTLRISKDLRCPTPPTRRGNRAPQ